MIDVEDTRWGEEVVSLVFQAILALACAVLLLPMTFG